MAANEILFLTGDFAQDYETMVPFQALQMVGHTVHVKWTPATMTR